MRSSWTHMFMVSLWNVETESSGGFSPGSSVTSLIILKSAWKKDLSVSVLTYISIRILLACIRFLASCPCPRCFTKKKDIAAMGTTIDTQRCAKVRRDDEHTQNKVDNTRRWIFEKGLGTESVAVERVLASESLVPIRVSPILFFILFFWFIFVSWNDLLECLFYPSV